MSKQEWIDWNLSTYKAADKDIIEFIANVLYHSGTEHSETIRRLYHCGYCYYFALMLKDAFNRGTICYAYYEGHIVWLDGTDASKDFAYDIDGVSKCWEYLIPIDKLGTGILDFKHIPHVQSEMTDTEIDKLLVNIIETKQYT